MLALLADALKYNSRVIVYDQRLFFFISRYGRM